MWKAILAGTTALAIAGSSLVYAQQRRAAPERTRWQPSQEDMVAFAAARIAALRAGLVLTPEQEKNWPSFEAALKDLSRYRISQRAARRSEQPAADPTERLRRRADALSGYGAALKKLADAQGPLYSSLDEAQKRRFAILAQPMRYGRGGHHRGMRHYGMRRTMQGPMRGPGGYERHGEWRGERGRGDHAWRWHGRQSYDGDDVRRNRSDGSGVGERL